MSVTSKRAFRLIGKTAWVWLDGHRSGKIKRVEARKRTGLRSVTVELPTGQRKKVEPRAFKGPLSGVMHRGILIDLYDAVALAKGGAA